jgi:hypothetical protein
MRTQRLLLICGLTGLLAAGVGISWRIARDPVDYCRLASGLGYVSRNYAEAVMRNGGAESQAEYAELRAVLNEVQAEAAQLPPWNRATASLIAAGAKAGLEAAPPAQVLPAINQAIVDLGHTHDLHRVPLTHPSWKHGEQLFAEACAVCHGADGAGRSATVLSTRPPDLRNPSWATRQSPVGVFGVVSYGIPETAMPSFSDAYAVDARWDLAFYVLTLSRPRQIAPQYMFPELKDYPLAELAIRSDTELTDILAGRGAVGSLGRTQLDYLRAVAPFVDR